MGEVALCNICGKRPAFGACGSSIGPFSYAICLLCLKMGAEPLDPRVSEAGPDGGADILAGR